MILLAALGIFVLGLIAGYCICAAVDDAPIVNEPTPGQAAAEDAFRVSLVQHQSEEVRNADYRDRERQWAWDYGTETEKINRICFGWLNGDSTPGKEVGTGMCAHGVSAFGSCLTCESEMLRAMVGKTPRGKA